MRFKEFKSVLTEGGDSKKTQFNSEVGLLAAMCGVDPDTFDPENPETSFANSPYTVGEDTLNNIKRGSESFNEAKFKKWAGPVGQKITSVILDQLEKLGYVPPTELSWVGGQNLSSVADVKFVNHPLDGISIKEAGAPTLSNLTAKALGLAGEDPDVFRAHAKAEWDDVKTHCFESVLEKAMAQPGKPFYPTKPKYSITYIEGEMPVVADKSKKSQPQVQPPPVQQPVSTEPAVPQQPVAQATSPTTPANPDVSTLKENVSQGYFEIEFAGKKVQKTQETIMSEMFLNKDWQRVFGDYFQSYWNRDQELKRLGTVLFTKIGSDFVNKIKSGLADQMNLHSVVKIGDKSYFYATPKDVFYVPSVSSKKGLKLIDLQYTNPKGTNQNFLATIGYEDEEPASVAIYIRYANGIFQANPTVRVQSLKNPQGLGWIKL